MNSNRLFDTDSLTCQVYTELADIEAIAPAWDSLLEQSACNRAFSSSKWFTATCRLNPSIEPYVIVARRGETVSGILPLALTDKGAVAAFPNYLCDYSDIIAAHDDLAAAAGLLHFALSAPDGYRRIVLANIRPDSHCLRAARAMESDPAVVQAYSEIVPCPYIRLPASYHEYLRSKSSRFRKRLRWLHGCASKKNLAVRELGPENFRPGRLSETFLSLHLSRQQAESCFGPAHARLFIEEVLPDLFIKRAVRVIALAAGENIVGIYVYTMGSNSLGAWNSGFLSEVAQLSPGKILINAGIEMACALGLEEYDFMRGAEAYKTGWANGSRPLGRIEFPVRGVG
jgi:CelD/BcsL family acetyltransferase involved in cellulose biosynthesis